MFGKFESQWNKYKREIHLKHKRGILHFSNEHLCTCVRANMIKVFH